MADELQALLARNQLGLSIAVDISQALKSYDPVSRVFPLTFFVTFSGRYENDVKVGIQAAVSDGSDGPVKEGKPPSSIGAPRQPADDLPSMGELFTAMDVPIFLTNDDVTPYDPPHPFLHHVSLSLSLSLNEAFPSATRSVPLEASATSSVRRVAGLCTQPNPMSLQPQ